MPALQNKYHSGFSTLPRPSYHGAGGGQGVCAGTLCELGSGRHAATEAAGCRGVCGGVEAICLEPEGAITSTSWAFVGKGLGGYDEVPVYNFVGHGHGNYDKEQEVQHYGYKLRPICLGIIVCLISVPVFGGLLGLFSGAPAAVADTTTSTTTLAVLVAFRESCEEHHETMRPTQLDLCCRKYGLFCADSVTVAPTTPPTPAPSPPPPQQPRAVGAKPTPPPPARQGALPPGQHLPAGISAGGEPWSAPQPFDCTAGLSNWANDWSAAKKLWCCHHGSAGCPATPRPARL